MLIKTEGMAILLDDEDETATTPTSWDFSHLTEKDPIPFEPKTDKRHQMLLF